jgi:putative oxidoreductase
MAGAGQSDLPALGGSGASAPVAMARDRALLLVRLVSGGVFVVFGVGKFVDHGSELASFRTYGLPAPAAFVIAIGVIELVGGLLLKLGILTRPAALVLAGDMVGAILISGIARGEMVSFTLAPAQLVAMLIVVWTGPGALSLRASPPAARKPRHLTELLR